MPNNEERRFHTALGMGTHPHGRREFLLMGAGLLAVAGARCETASKSVVSIVRIQNDKVELAVEKAIDLLGGIRQVTKGINTVMLKPNLVSTQVEATTKPLVVDMVRANKLGLVVVDGSMAMEGNGPSMGQTFKMNVIVAGTNPLATDMVAANLMGFEPNEIPTFLWANKAGMKPSSLHEIEIRGESLDRVRRPFAKPQLYAWNEIRSVWGAKEI